MKLYSIPLLLLLLPLGCAHGFHPASSRLPMSVSPVGSNSEEVRAEAPVILAESGSESAAGKIDNNEPGTAVKEETARTPDQRPPSVVPGTAAKPDNDTLDKTEIADPLEPFNRAMYHFNDKLYFWVLKPVAQGYQKVVPERARISVNNLFANLGFPVRFVNCLLQANFSGASTEFGRFLVNTIWGIGGLLDPASSKDIKLLKQDEDFGQTLGVYRVGQGFYITWPIFGPSSSRDTVGMVGDYLLHPFAHLTTTGETSIGIRAYEKVNATSLAIGDYESLKEAAIDPYVAIRDVYVQYRLKQVNVRTSAKPVLPR